MNAHVCEALSVLVFTFLLQPFATS